MLLWIVECPLPVLSLLILFIALMSENYNIKYLVVKQISNSL